jgi:Ran GTPase-activating protein (RanGAP) involved in mRNA processing and transport
MQYLIDTEEDNEALEIVIQGNDKHNFNNRIEDQSLVALVASLEQFAIYIEDIDLRYNEITDEGANALAELIQKSPRLLGLNLQGNKIKSEGA